MRQARCCGGLSPGRRWDLCVPSSPTHLCEGPQRQPTRQRVLMECGGDGGTGVVTCGFRVDVVRKAWIQAVVAAAQHCECIHVPELNAVKRGNFVVLPQ